MIFLTEALNDRPLTKYFGSKAQLAPLPYGDFNFFGVWEGGKNVTVAGERKKLGDLIQCIRDGRHIKQIQDAREAGFEFIFFIAEIKGTYRANPNTHLLEVPKGKGWKPHPSGISVGELDSYLEQLDWHGGVHVRQTSGAKSTVEEVLKIYKLFQKPPEAHTGLKKIYTAPLPQDTLNILSRRPNMLRRWANELPGVGFERSKAIEDHFQTPLNMVTSPPEDWLKIEGIGKGLIQKIQKAIKGEI